MKNLNRKYQLMLVDDHSIVRDGIKALLADQEHLEIEAEAQNGVEALEILRERAIDLVLIDINMPEMNGIECTEKIRKRYPNVQVLALSMLKEEQHIRHMLRAGAMGYILKDAGKDELLRGINAVLNDQNYFSTEASQVVMMDLIGRSQRKGKPTYNNPIYLTEREKDVLQLIAQEMTNQEIARSLHISSRTVDAHRRSLIQKIGARNAIGLVKYAIEHNLLKE